MKSGFLVAMAVALAPMAQAQDCSLLNGLIESGAKDGFEGIVDEEIDDGVFEAVVTFPRADACEVDALVPQYYCGWDTATQADADKVIMPLYDMAKVCLSEGWAWDDIAGQKFGSDKTVVEGYRMTKRSGAYSGAVVRVLMAAPAATGPQRLVWIDVQPE